MNQTFMDKMAQWLRLREMEFDATLVRSPEVRNSDWLRMRDLEDELNLMVERVRVVEKEASHANA